MTVWIYTLSNGEYQEMAVVEDGDVVQGAEGFVMSAFPEGIPESEEKVARMFNGPAAISTTDFDMDWTPEQPDVNAVQLEGIELESYPEWERALLELHEKTWEADSDTRVLSFTSSELPEFVMERLRQAILGDAIFSQFDTIPNSERDQLREYMMEEITESGGWTMDGLADRIQDLDVGLTQDEARVIARTETASVANSARAEGYEEQGFDDETFYWSGALDNRTTDACRWLIETTHPSHGGTPVPLDELRDLIEEAPEHDDDMDDNLARPNDYVVHPQERKTFVRHVE